MLSVGFLYLQEVLTQFSKRNGDFWFLANEYLKRRIVKAASEFSGQPKTRLTKTVSGNLLLLVWKAEYELVNTKKNKVGERVRRHWDIETHLHAHTVGSHIRSEICSLQSRFTVSGLDWWHSFIDLTLLDHYNEVGNWHYRLNWPFPSAVRSGVELRFCCTTAVLDTGKKEAVMQVQWAIRSAKSQCIYEKGLNRAGKGQQC